MNERGAWGTTLLRLTLGGVFLAHGIQKLVVWGWSGGAPFFRSAGIPLPEIAAPLVTLVEIVGGGLLLLGAGTRAAAAVLAVVMLVAGVTVHLPHGFFAPSGVEFVLVLGVGLVVLVLQGPGAFALGTSIGADPGRWWVRRDPTTPPLACVPGAIPVEERSTHVELTRRLFDSVRDARPMEDGYTFVFDQEALIDVARFVGNERRCCPFLTFAIEQDGDGGPVRLRLTGPEGTRAFLRAELPL